ncbi:MAG TPA: ABC transporter ATP-binding protein [Acidimicrobiia bacterium]|nr:ABC transporter ATP-binding protein [Acidimicrobiia bacterium]
MSEAILSLRHVSASYGPVRALDDISIDVQEGEIVCLLGSNAAGKSTTLRTILGMTRANAGEIVFDGERIEGLTTPEIVSRGLTMVPENRRLFGKMSVKENLEIGANLRDDKAAVQEDIERVFSLFPRLKERIRQRAGTLSGGEQQMLAIGRALTARPKVLLLDEPSMGLAPILVEQVFATIQEINLQGTTIFVVEQNAHMALSIANRGYVLQTGSIVLEDTAANLLQHPKLSAAYLGEME